MYFYRLFVFRRQRHLNHSLLEGLEKPHSCLLDSLFRCYFPKHNTIYHERDRDSWLKRSLQTCVVLWVEPRYGHHLFIRYIFRLSQNQFTPLIFSISSYNHAIGPWGREKVVPQFYIKNRMKVIVLYYIE